MHQGPVHSTPGTAASRARKPTRKVLAILRWAPLLACALPTLGWAALGDTALSISSDIQSLEASGRIEARAAYTIHELHTPTGTLIREFVAPSGVVFAVSWRGPFKPSMALLLGRHFTDYARAPRTSGSSRSRLIIEQPNLVVHAAGHMRSFSGIAFLPQLLPENVVEADLQ